MKASRRRGVGTSSIQAESTRRDFLTRAGSLLGCGAVAGAPLASVAQESDEIPAGGGKAKRVIWLTMRGGMSQFETFCPTAGAQQPGSPGMIQSAIPGHTVSEWIPKLAGRLGSCAIVRSLQTMGVGHAEKGEYVMRTGYLPRTLLVHACLGSWISWHRTQQEIPSWNFRIAGQAMQNEAFLGPRHAPQEIHHPEQGALEVGSKLSVEELNQRQAVWEKLNARYGSKRVTGEFAQGLSLMRKKVEEIANVAKASPADQMRYGNSSFGRGCLIARRLAQADLSVFTEVILDGWDAPAPYFPAIRGVTGVMDQAVSSLISDLENEGLLEDTLVVLATPIGRSPMVAEGRRLEYTRAFCLMMAGGGVVGGTIYGRNDEIGRRVIEGGASLQDINTTVAWALGIDYRKTAFSHSQRPFTLQADRKARPITALFGK